MYEVQHEQTAKPSEWQLSGENGKEKQTIYDPNDPIYQ